MCGIAGYWNFGSESTEKSVLKRMTDAISHRGPDGEGQWFSENNRIGLGHRRLSIIDLSDNGKQPMLYKDEFILVFNGEIYNYKELKSTLVNKGYIFQNQTDTEVVLAAYKEWGKDCVLHFDGMFAIALYDKVKNILFCARDRFGEKPFYYTIQNGVFYFASEIKALWESGVNKVVDNQFIYNFFVYDLVDNPKDQSQTFFSNVKKLKPAHYFEFSGQKIVNQIAYWKLSTETHNHLDLKSASLRLMELLDTSVKRRLRSDVPVGTSLSGGLDSSTIVGLVSRYLDTNQTFSARFSNFEKDEGAYIQLVKDKFKTNHHDIFISQEHLYNDLEKIIFHQDEPFQSGSVFAQYCVYKSAKEKNVTVMLDGQGADEVLAGYPKYFKTYLSELLKGGKSIEKISKELNGNHSVKFQFSKKDNFQLKFPFFYDKLSKINWSLSKKNLPKGIASEFQTAFYPKVSPFTHFDDLKSMLKDNSTNQGLEKLLRFADRNSMAHAVEVRLPFLNHDLVEFIMSLESYLFFENGWSKSILREGVNTLLPQEITYRKDKVGFEAPDDQWMKDERFKELIHDSKSKLIQEKIITDQNIDSWKIINIAHFLG